MVSLVNGISRATIYFRDIHICLYVTIEKNTIMQALNYISDAVKELLLQILLFFDRFDYSAIFPEGNFFILFTVQ